MFIYTVFLWPYTNQKQQKRTEVLNRKITIPKDRNLKLTFKLNLNLKI